MKKKSIQTSKLFLILLAFQLSSCKGKKEVKVEPIKVKTEIVKRSIFEKKLNLVGEIQALENIDVFPKIAGNITSYSFDNGEKVTENSHIKKDQIFAILDHEEMEIGLKKTKASLEISKANLQISEVNLNDASRDEIRMTNLFEKGAITDKQKQESLSHLKRMQAQCLQAKAMLLDSKASLKQAKISLDKAFIKSPIDGVLTIKYISENNMANPSRPLANISNLKELKILIGIPEKIISEIDPKTSLVDVKVDAYSDKTFKAEIEKIYPTIDKNTRMGTLELRIVGNALLKPGMYANVILHFQKNQEIIKVPFSSLIYHQGSYQAYIYKDGKAYLKKLEIGDRNDNFVEVTSGLQENDYLIVLGQNKLTDQIDVSLAQGQSPLPKERSLSPEDQGKLVD
ncbi:MAG: Macrolide export protein MacA [Candidatus Anoxychlamydiales bacterium]|nr:Macrolide export protein MacA [Candidatus Anoxychlamydiales bacterium]